MLAGLLSLVALTALVPAGPAHAADTATISRNIYLGPEAGGAVLPSTPAQGLRILLAAGDYRWGYKLEGSGYEFSVNIKLARGYYLWQCYLQGPKYPSNGNYGSDCFLMPENPNYSLAKLNRQDMWLYGDYRWVSYLDPQF
ncbi:hypothetical protein AB0M37_22940 [Micromonospora chalcea]